MYAPVRSMYLYVCHCILLWAGGLKLLNHLSFVIVYDASVEKLNAEQRQKLKKLLCDHQDVFANHDFDLGTVTAIQHTIDNGTAKSVKQRMRRTPACFANEEEELLKKMLDAGVIQESVSEWASSRHIPPIHN